MRGVELGGGSGGAVRLRGEVERYMLFRYQSRADAGSEVFVEESGYNVRGYVASAFEEATGEDWDGIVVGLD